MAVPQAGQRETRKFCDGRPSLLGQPPIPESALHSEMNGKRGRREGLIVRLAVVHYRGLLGYFEGQDLEAALSRRLAWKETHERFAATPATTLRDAIRRAGLRLPPVGRPPIITPAPRQATKYGAVDMAYWHALNGLGRRADNRERMRGPWEP